MDELRTEAMFYSQDVEGVYNGMCSFLFCKVLLMGEKIQGRAGGNKSKAKKQRYRLQQEPRKKYESRCT